jgi:hypothetical protein
VPTNLKGQFTAELEYESGPFPATSKKTNFTIR